MEGRSQRKLTKGAFSFSKVLHFRPNTRKNYTEGVPGDKPGSHGPGGGSTKGIARRVLPARYESVGF